MATTESQVRRRGSLRAVHPVNCRVRAIGSTCSIRVSISAFVRFWRIWRKRESAKFFVFNNQHWFESHPLRQTHLQRIGCSASSQVSSRLPIERNPAAIPYRAFLQFLFGQVCRAPPDHPCRAALALFPSIPARTPETFGCCVWAGVSQGPLKVAPRTVTVSAEAKRDARYGIITRRCPRI